MKVLFASPSKIAGVVGIKSTEMRDFLVGMGKDLKSEQKSFIKEGEAVHYQVFEVVKALAYYEAYEAAISQMHQTIRETVVAETVLPEVSASVKKTTKNVGDGKSEYSVETKAAPRSSIPEIDVNEDEIPF